LTDFNNISRATSGRNSIQTAVVLATLL